MIGSYHDPLLIRQRGKIQHDPIGRGAKPVARMNPVARMKRSAIRDSRRANETTRISLRSIRAT
ncbi:MAG: hypothetical protein MZV49_20040, partial [Rhodopseudomonas palustris]|nr:hypothetical protein [Rhodopseudomonas palustris]